MNEYINDLRIAQNDIPNIELLEGKRVFITGAGGLIGSSVVEFLHFLNIDRRYNVKIYAGMRSEEKFRELFDKSFSDVEFVKYDAIETLNISLEFDYIIHTASPANPANYSKNPVETILANVFGINNLMRYMLDYSNQRLLYVSSSEVYGKKENPNPYVENEFGYLNILNSRACYPSAKRCSETLCSAYKQQFGIDFVVARPGHVYGPNISNSDNRASSQFIKDAASGNGIVMKSAGNQLRSYCYVVDCVSSLITILLNGESGEAYNVSNQKSIHTIREFAECASKISGTSIGFEHPTEEEKSSYNLMENSSLDSRMIVNLGWTGRFDLYSGVSHTIEAYKLKLLKTSLNS